MNQVINDYLLSESNSQKQRLSLNTHLALTLILRHLHLLIFNHKQLHLSPYIKYPPIPAIMTKQIHKCIFLLKRQTNRCVVASIHDTFQTNVSYNMPLNILLNYFQQVHGSVGAVQPLLTALCCTRVPSQMPESSCKAFPSSAWMHPGLTFAQKIQNIWNSSNTLYALFLI